MLRVGRYHLTCMRLGSVVGSTSSFCNSIALATVVNFLEVSRQTPATPDPLKPRSIRRHQTYVTSSQARGDSHECHYRSRIGVTRRSVAVSRCDPDADNRSECDLMHTEVPSLYHMHCMEIWGGNGPADNAIC